MATIFLFLAQVGSPFFFIFLFEKRWQQNEVDLATGLLKLFLIYICRFNGLYFLEKWRGKKIMFVGDSLSFNQWQSLTCMIHAWVPKSKYSYFKRDGFASVTFEVCFTFIFIFLFIFFHVIAEEFAKMIELYSFFFSNKFIILNFECFELLLFVFHGDVELLLSSAPDLRFATVRVCERVIE